MALSQSVLGGLIKTEIKAIAGINITQDAELEKFCNAVAKAVVDHIKAAAEVNPGTLAITPSAIVAPPGAGGGPCSGSGTVTSGKGTVS
jgi:hypothetical protein